MEKATLSVIVPVYNVEEYIGKCLDSILAQKRLPEEILCVNDGSTDGSLAVLKEYETKSSLIRIINKENGGLVSARKAGLLQATGDYISYIDGDDWIEEEMYSGLMQYADSHMPDIITSQIIRDYGTSQVLDEDYIPEGLYQGEEVQTRVCSELVDTENFFRKNLKTHMASKLFRREFLNPLQQNVPDALVLGEDEAVVYPAILATRGIYISHEAYYHYCFRQESLCHGSENSWLDIIAFLKTAMASVVESDDRIRRQFDQITLAHRLYEGEAGVLNYADGVLSPYGNIPEGSRVVVYGAGTFGKVLHGFVQNCPELHLVAWVDKNSKLPGIIRPDEMNTLDFDFVLIAVVLGDVAASIEGALKDMGIPPEKIKRVTCE